MKIALCLILLLSLGMQSNAGTESGAPDIYRHQIQVVDSANRPLAGAAVEGEEAFALMPSLLEKEDFKCRGITDAKGTVSFTVTNRPAMMFVAMKAGFSIGWIRSDAKPGVDETIGMIELTAPASVSGVVKDTAGRPVADATVWPSSTKVKDRQAAPESFRFMISPLGRKYLNSQTDPDGVFTITGLPQNSTLNLAASKPGMMCEPKPVAYADLDYHANQSGINLTLVPTATLEGRVVEEQTETPVAGAILVPLGYIVEDPLRRFIPTGTDGTFRLTNLKPSQVVIRAILESNTYPDWISEPVSVDLNPAETRKDFKITAVRGGLVEVMVRAKNGNQPLEKVMLVFNDNKSLERMGSRVMTSAQGIAKVKLLPGQYTIAANKAGWIFERTPVICEFGKTNRVSIGATPTPRLEGQVQDAEGKPVVNIPVTLVPMMQEESVSTDPEGRFSLLFNQQMYGNGPRPESFILARDPAGNRVGALEIENGLSNSTFIVKLDQGLTLAGKVVDNEGHAVSNALLRLTQRIPSGESGLNIGSTTDAEGRYELKGLPADWRYRIDVSAKGYADDQKNLNAAAPSAHRMEIEPFKLLKASLPVMGVVLDEAGKPVTGVFVSMGGIRQPSASVITDNKGHFSFNEACAGPVHLSARFKDSVGSIEAQGGDTNVIVRLGKNDRGMPPDGKSHHDFAGIVLDTQGKPASNILIQRFPDDYNVSGLMTDSQGRFKMTLGSQGAGSRSMAYVVFAIDTARNLAGSVILDEDATNASLQLEPTWLWKGSVVDASGTAISNAIAQPYFRSPNFARMYGSPVHSDAQGRFEIKGLPRGWPFRIDFTAPGYGRASCESEAPVNGKLLVEAPPVQLINADLSLGGVVVDDQDKPVKGASINAHGEQQPNLSCQSDRQGRFLFKNVIPGNIEISASDMDGRLGMVKAEAGETNIILHVYNPGEQQRGVLLPKITGTVLDVDGKPVKNARVNILPAARGEEKTDELGHFIAIKDTEPFMIPITEWVAMASVPELNRATSVDLDASVTKLTLRLEPAWALSGRVTDASGTAMSNVQVQLFFHISQIGNSLGKPVPTDADGRYEIKGLAKGRPYVLRFATLGYGKIRITVEPPTNVAQRVEVDTVKMLPADQVLAGVVLDDQDKPVRGASVYVTGDGPYEGNTRTDINGKFLLKNVVPGQYTNSASEPKGGYGTVVAKGGDTNIVIKFGRRRALPQAESKPTLRIPGVVVDTEDKPAANIQLSIFPSKPGRQATDAQGRFLLFLNPDQLYRGSGQHVVFAVDAIRNLAASLDLDEESTNADMKLEPAWTLAGRVIDPNGNAVANAQLELSFKAGYIAATYGKPVSVNREGRFEFKGLPQGRSFNGMVTAKGYSRSNIRVTAPEEGVNRVDTAPVQLLAANLSVAGVVLDENDQPVKGVAIQCSGETQSERAYRTDSQGRFSINGICPGQVHVSASHSNGKHAMVLTDGGDTNIVLRFVEQKKNVPITAKPRPQILGVAVDSNDLPMPNIELVVFPSGQEKKTTDSQGRFSLTLDAWGVQRDRMQSVVFARDPTRTLAASLSLDQESTNIDLRLEPAWTLAGRMVDTDKAAITNAQVELFFQSMRLTALYGIPAVTDREGRFEIKGLPQGRSFNVSISANGYNRLRIRAGAPETNKNRVELEPIQLLAANMTLGGVVLDEKDRPMRSVMVQCSSENQAGKVRMTDRQGRFVFKGIGPGHVQVSANDSYEQYGAITTEGGDTNVILRLVASRNSVKPGANLRPRINTVVMDPDGRPARNIRLVFPSLNTEQTTDSAGRLSLNPNTAGIGMVRNQFVLLAMDPVRNLAFSTVLDGITTNASVQLKPAWTLAGRVVDTDKAAITNAQAQLFHRNGSLLTPFGQHTPVDNEGRFVVKGLPQGGSFDVSLSADGYGRTQIKVEPPVEGKVQVETDPIQLPRLNLTLGGMVLDGKGQPVGDVTVQIASERQPGANRLSDRLGKFLFRGVAPGRVHAFAYDLTGRSASLEAEGGDTNIILRLGSSDRRSLAPRPGILKGKPMPDLVALGLSQTNISAKQSLLIAVVDTEQRLSRNALKALSDRAKALKDKGVAIVALHTSAISNEAFAKWQTQANLPFPMLSLQESRDKYRADWGVTELPWLILTDTENIVTAEGISFEELARLVP